MATTIKNIADQLGVSHVTVSKVLRGQGRISDKTSRRIKDLARELDYRPNAAARSMTSRKTRTIGVLLINTGGTMVHANYVPSIFEAMIGANGRLEADGYTLNLVNISDVGKGPGQESRVFTEHLVDGFLVLGRMPDTICDRVRGLTNKIVWCEGNTWEPTLCIRRDEVAAGAMVVDHLAAAGVRRIVWAGGALGPSEAVHYSGIERFSGAVGAAARQGLGVETIVLEKANFFATAPDPKSIAAMLAPETGIVAYDGETARWLIDALVPLGLLPGRDYSIACCDDSQTIRWFLPHLARVSFDRYRLGWDAADMLVRLLSENPSRASSTRLSGQWIDGNSIGGVSNVT